MDWVHTASTSKGISTILMRMHPSGALKRAGASEAGGCNLGYGQHPVTTIDRTGAKRIRPPSPPRSAAGGRGRTWNASPARARFKAVQTLGRLSG
jgi:hypothetical protein